MPEDERQLDVLLQLQAVCKQEQGWQESLQKLQEDKAAITDTKIQLTASQRELQVKYSGNLTVLLLLSV